MSENEKPATKPETGISTTDAAAASVLVLMALLPALQKSKAIHGEKFIEMLDKVAAGAAKTVPDGERLLRAVEGLTTPLRTVVAKQKAEAAKAEAAKAEAAKAEAAKAEAAKAQDSPSEPDSEPKI